MTLEYTRRSREYKRVPGPSRPIEMAVLDEIDGLPRVKVDLPGIQVLPCRIRCYWLLIERR